MQNRRRPRIIVFAFALVLAIATTIGIALSMGAIRDGVHFSRVLRRIDQGDTSDERIAEAIEYARRPGDWQRLMRVVWDRDADDRWTLVRDVAEAAMGQFPRDNRWAHAEALAAIRLGDVESAREILHSATRRSDPLASPVGESLYLLAAIDPDNRTASLDRLRSVSPDRAPTIAAVSLAEESPSPETLAAAWEVTAVAAYAVNAALESAVGNDKATARGMVERVREAGLLPSAQETSAPLYLAAWLDDIPWLFDQLRGLRGPRAVDPDVLLVQADGLVRQEQYTEARRIYRELQRVSPADYPLIYLNDAAITIRLRDGDPIEILRQGHAQMPETGLIGSDLAALLVADDRRIEAARIIAPLVNGIDTVRHQDWLLVRAVLGSRRPLARLESDLWQYLNDNRDADIVAAFLARFLSLRGDQEGIAQLLRRYGPETGEWAVTLHLSDSIRRNDLAEAEERVSLYADSSPTAWYNRALFALRFLPMPESEEVLAAYRTWLDRGAGLSEEQYRLAEIRYRLLSAEHARLQGDIPGADAAAERALALSPGDEAIRAYRALLAPRQ